MTLSHPRVTQHRKSEGQAPVICRNLRKYLAPPVGDIAERE